VQAALATDGYDPWPSWRTVAEDPIEAVCARNGDERTQLAELGVYETNARYPVARFALTDKATKALGQLAAMTDIDAAQATVTLGADDLRAAEALRGAHHTSAGFNALIAGQDVADQLSSDGIVRALGQRRKAERNRAAAGLAHSRRPADATEGPAPDAAMPAVDEAEQRRLEREAQTAKRANAAARNERLGTAVVKHLSRIKPDPRAVRILTTIDLQGDLTGIAARGARYGFPGWTVERTTKTGRTRTDYAEPAEAQAKAVEYLAGAQTAADHAGRCLALIVMAYLADEHCIAQSRRATTEIRAPYGDRGLPWAGGLQT
jgi:hypothetical protein